MKFLIIWSIIQTYQKLLNRIPKKTQLMKEQNLYKNEKDTTTNPKKNDFR